MESPAAVYVLRPSTTTPGWRRCHLRDVSACGAGVEAVGLDLDEGDAVLVRFGTEAEGFQVRGRVVRMDAGSVRSAYGVRFGGLDPRQVDSLYKFVMRHATAARRN